MPGTVIKEIELQNIAGNVNAIIGADSINIDTPRDDKGKIITDSTEPTSIESLDTSLENIEDNMYELGSKNLIPNLIPFGARITTEDGLILENSSTGIIIYPQTDLSLSQDVIYTVQLDYNFLREKDLFFTIDFQSQHAGSELDPPEQLWSTVSVKLQDQLHQTIEPYFDWDSERDGSQQILLPKEAEEEEGYNTSDNPPAYCTFTIMAGTYFDRMDYIHIAPMLRLASIKDRTFENYAMTNQELTNILDNIDMDNKMNIDGSNSENIVTFKSVQTGNSTTAIGNYSHAEGSQTTANGNYSHSEGYRSISGLYSHAEGNQTTAAVDYSHSEGVTSRADGTGSHAEGSSTTANGQGSHAEGLQTVAKGPYSHAEGRETTAFGGYSHAEGYKTATIAQYSHAEGYKSIANKQYSFAGGLQGKTDPLYRNNLDKEDRDQRPFTGDSCFAIGGKRDSGTSSTIVDYNENLADKTDYNIFNLDTRGNFFTKGAQTLANGYIDGIKAGGMEFGTMLTLEDGAIYLLHCTGQTTSTKAYRGTTSYLIATNFDMDAYPKDDSHFGGMPTSALAEPKIKALTTIGSTPVTLIHGATQPSLNSNWYPYIGIGAYNTSISVRWNLIKVCGSMDDFY